jgi:sulfiredoxin
VEIVAVSPIDIEGEESRSCAGTEMLKRQIFAIADIYVPVKRRMTLNPATVRKIAESILEVGLQSPILVRQDGARLVLVEGLHRLEACKELGEQNIVAFLVHARRH